MLSCNTICKEQRILCHRCHIAAYDFNNIIHLISLVEWSLSFDYVLERIKDFFCVYFRDVSILK